MFSRKRQRTRHTSRTQSPLLEAFSFLLTSQFESIFQSEFIKTNYPPTAIGYKLSLPNLSRLLGDLALWTGLVGKGNLRRRK